MATNQRKSRTSTTVYLTQSQEERLERLSKNTRIPKATIVREGLERVLKEAEQKGGVNFSD